MSPPETSSGAPPQGPATAQIATTTKTQQTDDATAVRVPATFLRPSGRRTLGVLIVTRCPWCELGGHVHRGAGGVRRSGCDRGDYVLVPHSDVRPKRGAA